jgi:hypothetical protein
MKRGITNILSAVLFALGLFFILNSLSGITGFVVFENVEKNTGTFVGLVFLLGGLAGIWLAMEPLEKRVEKTFYKIDQKIHGKARGTYSELISLAKKLDYDVVQKSAHTGIYYKGNKVTEIPRHTGDVPTGTFKDILQKLRKGRDYLF